MGKLIKFLISALLLFGAWQVALVQWDQFKFKDAVRELAEFRPDQGDEEMRTAVVAEATKLGIRVDPSRVNVRRVAERIYIDVTYTRPVRVLPWYQYNWDVAFSVESWYVLGGRLK